MFKRLVLLLAASMALLVFLRYAGLLRPIFNWIYGGFLHDKIAHFTVGSAYTLLLAWCTHPRKWQWGRVGIPLGAAWMFALAVVDELLQIPMRGRDSNPFDLLASLIGVGFGVLAWNLWQAWQRQRQAGRV